MHYEQCEMKPIPCTNDGCNVEVIPENMEFHRKNNCEFRTENCEVCLGSYVLKYKINHFTDANIAEIHVCYVCYLLCFHLLLHKLYL